MVMDGVKLSLSHTSQPFKMKKRDKIGENVGF